jgi:hypothetical protein
LSIARSRHTGCGGAGAVCGQAGNAGACSSKRYFDPEARLCQDSFQKADRELGEQDVHGVPLISKDRVVLEALKRLVAETGGWAAALAIRLHYGGALLEPHGRQ